MSYFVVGIDPGVTGAIAVLAPGEKDDRLPLLMAVVDMPVLEIRKGRKNRKQINAVQLATVLRDYQAVGFFEVWIEDLKPMPQIEKEIKGKKKRIGHGSVAAFALGKSLGAIETVVALSNCPLMRVSAAKWKRAMGLIGQGKDASRACFPTWQMSSAARGTTTGPRRR